MRTSNITFLGVVLLLGALALVCHSTLATEVTPPETGQWPIDISDATFTGRTGYVEGDLHIMGLGMLSIVDSVLTVNQSLIVFPDGGLLIKNSTIIFNCSIDTSSEFFIFNDTSVTITDSDNDYRTEGDRSIITSANQYYFNWTVEKQSAFILRNSLVSRCGRYFDDPDLTEGFLLKADNSIIEGTNITDGYYGLLIEDVEKLTMENCSIMRCEFGILMRGARDVRINSCNITDNRQDGVIMRGFQAELDFSDNLLARNRKANLRILFGSGYSIELSRNTFGPGGEWGILTEGIDEYLLQGNNVTGCDVGIELRDSKLDLLDTYLSNCTSGLNVIMGGELEVENVRLYNTTLRVDPDVRANLTASFSSSLVEVKGDLGCTVHVKTGGTMSIEGSTLNFTDSYGSPSGIIVEPTAKLTITGSTLQSPVSMRWTFKALHGSLLDIRHSELKHLGDSSGGPEEKGLYISGGGDFEGVTFSDSLYGIVSGRTLASLTDLTFVNCTIAVVIDGALGRGGAEIRGVDISDCDLPFKVVNDGTLTVHSATIDPVGEAFNISKSTLTIRDSVVLDPPGSTPVASLQNTATLDIVNTTMNSRLFNFGDGFNSVNIYWYLNLVLTYLSDGSPLADASVEAEDRFGVTVPGDIVSGPDGMVDGIELKEKSYTPDEVVSTPHNLTISIGGLSDYLTVEMTMSRTVTFSMDNIPPLLSILEPSPDAILNVSDVVFSGTAQDGMVTERGGLDVLRYMVDNGTWVDFTLQGPTDWTFELPLEDGEHTITVEVIDVIGNRASEQLSITVDTEPPRLDLLNPPRDILTNTPELTFLGITDPGVDLTLNGLALAISEFGEFNSTVSLTEGENQFVLIASDDLGNINRLEVLITLDTTPPDIVIEHPDPWRVNTIGIDIIGVKEMGATLYVNGDLPGFIPQESFCVTVPLVEGDNSIVVQSIDPAGNLWSQTFKIERDTTAPSLIVDALPKYSRSPRISVTGRTNDDGAIVTVNGVLMTLMEGVFVHPMDLVEGLNTITVEARDDLLNSAEPVTFEVTLDTMDPPLTLMTEGYVSTELNTHELSGTTEPGAIVKVEVTYGPDVVSNSSTAGPDGSFSFTILLPRVGNHTITITVSDDAGNSVSKTVYFERVRVTSPPRPEPTGPSWISENWEYLVLLASIVASIGVLLIAMAPRKRRRTMARAPEVAPRPEETDEEWEEEEPEDEDEETEGEETVEDLPEKDD